MTANPGFREADRRPGELGVHSLDHFHFVVPGSGRRRRLSTDEFGLAVGEAAPPRARRAGPAARLGHDRRGPRKKHQYVSFGVFEDDLDRFAERLQDHRRQPPRSASGRRIRTGSGSTIHDGNLVEIAVAPKTSPNEKSAFVAPSAGAGRPRRAEPQRRRAHLSAPARAYADVHHATCARRSTSIRGCLACGSPTIPAKASRSCTAFTAAIIT